MAIKNPVVRKIFDDLDEFHNFCRTEGHKFDQKFLYNSESRQWHAFQSNSLSCFMQSHGF